MSEELTMKKYHFIITPTGERKLVFSPDVTYIDGKDAECLYNQIMNGEPSTETDEQAMKKIAEEDARLRTLEANGAQMFAKCLANDRISIGRNRLMAWLRKEKYIDSANVAYQRYIDQEIFEVKETVYYVGTTYHTSRKTLITPKGQVYLAKKVSKEYKG